jgi:hypothetical protein
MAIKTVLIDDLDGTPLASGASSTSFSINGVSYEIDLAPENVEQLRAALAPFIAAGRRAGAAPAKATRASKASDPARLAAIRTWARANGHAVSDRGRIASSIMDAYEKAN